jgi:hypothetical protein
MLAATACSGPAPRFTDGPVVTEVDDTRDIPEPRELEFWRFSHHVDNFFDRQLTLGLDPVPAGPAQDVNRAGQVVNSSWYQNRTATLTPEQVAQGPGGDDPGPEAFRPWTITGMKVGGRNPGFVFEDARGARYICKFDRPDAPVVTTAAGAIAARLLWACGYHTPDDRVIAFARDDLVIGEGATFSTPAGENRPLTPAQIDNLLAELPSRQTDGTYRALASRFLDGRPLGGYSYNGTRDDDPNDAIPHQNRRSLRALRVFGAWLNHVDLKIDNTLDLYTEEDGRRFIRHYLVDFDGCLGGYWAARHESRIGYAYDLDLAEVATGIPSVGLYRRPYEHLVTPAHPEVGVFDADAYDPATWKPNYLNDHVDACRPADAYWAGTVLAQLTPAHIRAAVESGRFHDPAAVDVLTDILVTRREKTIDWALTQVTPVTGVDAITQDSEGLHIAARNTLADFQRPWSLAFDITLLDAGGHTLHSTQNLDSPAVTIPAAIANDHDYLIVRWTAHDGRHTLPASEAHYRKTNTWHLAGILRDGQ